METKNRTRRRDNDRCECLRRREERIVAVISSRMTGERRKLSALLKSVRRDFRRDLGSARREILEATRAVEASVDLIAQELARGGEATNESPRTRE